MIERGEENHGKAEHPKNQQEYEGTLQANLEEPEEADHRQFNDDKPKAAREEKAGELRFGAAILLVEEGADTGCECKDRCAEMSDPASEEKRSGGTGKVGGFECKCGGADEVADMVERHDDHDESAKSIHGLDAWLRKRRVGRK